VSETAIFITAELEISEQIDTATGRKAIIQFCADMESEPGCDMAKPMAVKDNPRRFILWEKYQSPTAFEAHFNAEHTQAFIRSGVTTLVQAFETTAAEE